MNAGGDRDLAKMKNGVFMMDIRRRWIVQFNDHRFIELKGDGVYLRKLGQEYLESYWESMDHVSVESTIYTGTQQIFTKSDLESYLESIASDPSRIDFLIFTHATHELVGEVVLNEISRINRSANIRVSLFHKDHFGQGYGTEAILLALNYGFGMYNLHRIELGVLSFNTRGIHVYEKIGFQKEGVLRDAVYFDHQYYDLITMSILEDEFRKKYRTEINTLGDVS